MDFPYGQNPHHSHHHHHNRRRDDDDEPNREGGFYPPPPGQPYPPPPYYGNEPPPPSNPYPPPYYENEPPPPPPPQVAHVYHTSHTPSYGGPPGSDFYNSPQDPPPPAVPGNAFVEHVSHQSHRPHVPSFISHHSHESHNPAIPNMPTVRVYCKAESNYSLAIRDGKVILARSDPSDPFQHWIKDEKYSTRVKDEEGFPSFALVNKATGQAMKHSIGATHPVQLVPYNPEHLDESVLWTLSRDTGENFRTIRMVNNIRLNVDAFNGDKNHGGVHDGTTIVLWEWKKGENQRWKIVPY
ncbi:OLC1v1025426C3 [Oldenlandia corymbosa var. corymbosa]|nr:OLC1v1025426C3 [Oldenlandia corymbosa var. corymbosa]